MDSLFTPLVVICECLQPENIVMQTFNTFFVPGAYFVGE